MFLIRKVTRAPDMTAMTKQEIKEMHKSQGLPPKGICSTGAIFSIDSDPEGQLQKVWVSGRKMEFYRKRKEPFITRKCLLPHAIAAMIYKREKITKVNKREEIFFNNQSRLTRFRLGLDQYANMMFDSIGEINNPKVYFPYDIRKSIIRPITGMQLKSLISVNHHGSALVFHDQIERLRESRKMIQDHYSKFLHQLCLECFSRFWKTEGHELIPFISEISTHELDPEYFLQDLQLQDVLLDPNIGYNINIPQVCTLGEDELLELILTNVKANKEESVDSLGELMCTLNNVHLFRIGVGKMEPIITFVLGQLYKSHVVGFVALEKFN